MSILKRKWGHGVSFYWLYGFSNNKTCQYKKSVFVFAIVTIPWKFTLIASGALHDLTLFTREYLNLIYVLIQVLPRVTCCEYIPSSVVPWFLYQYLQIFFEHSVLRVITTHWTCNTRVYWNKLFNNKYSRVRVEGEEIADWWQWLSRAERWVQGRLPPTRQVFSHPPLTLTRFVDLFTAIVTFPGWQFNTILKSVYFIL